MAVEKLQEIGAPYTSPMWNISSRIERFIALCCIALLFLLAIKNLVVEYYVLAVFIGTLMATLWVDVLSSIRGDPLPVPVSAILAVLAATILATIWYCGPQGALWAFPAIVGGSLVEARRAGVFFSVPLIFTVSLLVMWQGEVTLAIRLFLSLSLTTAYMWFSVTKTRALQQKLLAASTRDPLTGSYNRRYLNWVAGQTNGKLASVMLVDIDHFKEVNDSLGHARGDLVLKQVALLMDNVLGNRGTVFRVGGEEFLILLESRSDGLVLAEIIRKRISDAEILPDRVVTVSIGVVQKTSGETLQNAQRRADSQLYLAKQQGRNRVSKG